MDEVNKALLETPMQSSPGDLQSLRSFLSLSRDEKMRLTSTPGRLSQKASIFGVESPLLDNSPDVYDFDDTILSVSGDGDGSGSSGDGSDVSAASPLSPNLGVLGGGAQVIAMKAMLGRIERERAEEEEQRLDLQRELGLQHQQRRELAMRGVFKTWRASLARRAFRLWVVCSSLVAHAKGWIDQGKQEALIRSLLRSRGRRVLVAWRGLVSRRDTARESFCRLVGVATSRMLRAGFVAWRLRCTSAEADGRLRLAALHQWSYGLELIASDRRAKLRAVLLWRRLVAWQRLCARRLHVAARVLSRRCGHVSLLFHHWRALTCALPLRRLEALLLLDRYHLRYAQQAERVLLSAAFSHLRRVAAEERRVEVRVARGITAVNHWWSQYCRRRLLLALGIWQHRASFLARAAAHMSALLTLWIARRRRDRQRALFRRWTSLCIEQFELHHLNNRLEMQRAVLGETRLRAAAALSSLRDRSWRRAALMASLHSLRGAAKAAASSRRSVLTACIARMLGAADASVSAALRRTQALFALYRWKAVATRTAAMQDAATALFSAVAAGRARVALQLWKAHYHRCRQAEGIARLFARLSLGGCLNRWARNAANERVLHSTLHRLARRCSVYLLRWFLRRWSYVLARTRINQGRLGSLSLWLPLWRSYSSLLKRRRLRLGHVLYLTYSAALRSSLGRWAAKTRQASRLARACHLTLRYFGRAVMTVKRIALGRWRAAARQRGRVTQDRLGKGLTMALQRIVLAEQGREEEVVRCSMHEVEIGRLRAYARALLHQATSSFGRRRQARVLRLCMKQWAAVRDAKQRRKRALAALTFHRGLRAIHAALAARFALWRRMTARLSLTISAVAALRRRLATGLRRRRARLLAWSFRAWAGRKVHNRALGGAMSRIRVASLRRHVGKAFYRWRRALLRDLTLYRTAQRRWFQRLCAHASKQRAARDLAWRRVAALARHRRRLLRLRVLLLWCAEAAKQRRDRLLLLRASSLVARCAARRSLAHWRHLQSGRDCARRFCRRLRGVVSARLRQSAARFFSRWRRACTYGALTSTLASARRWALQRCLHAFFVVPLLAGALGRWRLQSASLARRLGRDRALSAVLARRADRRLLGLTWNAWRRHPQVTLTLPLRLHGPRLLLHALCSSAHWTAALHAEASGHRSLDTTLELLLEGLSEALPGWAVAVYVLGDGVLRGKRQGVGAGVGSSGTVAAAAAGPAAGGAFADESVLVGEGLVGRCAASGQGAVQRVDGREGGRRVSFAPPPVRNLYMERRGAADGLGPGSRPGRVVSLVLPLLWHDDTVGVVQLSPPGTSPSAQSYHAESLPPLPTSLSVLAGLAGPDGSALPGLEGGTRTGAALLAAALCLSARADGGGIVGGGVGGEGRERGDLSLQVCIAVAPLLYAAADLFHLYYAADAGAADGAGGGVGDGGRGAWGEARAHVDPPLAPTLQALAASNAKCDQLTLLLHRREAQAAARVAALEASLSLQQALHEEQMRAVKGSRDRYRARVLKQWGGKENESGLGE